MESQYFESNPNKNGSIILNILMVVGILFLITITVYAFFSIQKSIKEANVSSVTNNNTISISETGIVYAVPDIATVTFSTINQNANISEVLKKDGVSVASITDSLKKQGVADADIKTVDFNVYPQYQWQTKGIDLSVYPLGKRVIIGYEATHSIQVIIRDINQAGNIIQGAVAAGASQVGDLLLFNSKIEELKSQARDLAIKQAKDKAIAVAAGLGVNLGKTVSFTESYFTPTLASSATVGTGPSLQILTGDNKIQATVNVSYEIK